MTPWRPGTFGDGAATGSFAPWLFHGVDWNPARPLVSDHNAPVAPPFEAPEPAGAGAEDEAPLEFDAALDDGPALDEAGGEDGDADSVGVTDVDDEPDDEPAPDEAGLDGPELDGPELDGAVEALDGGLELPEPPEEDELPDPAEPDESAAPDVVGGEPVVEVVAPPDADDVPCGPVELGAAPPAPPSPGAVAPP